MTLLFSLYLLIGSIFTAIMYFSCEKTFSFVTGLVCILAWPFIAFFILGCAALAVLVVLLYVFALVYAILRECIKDFVRYFNK